MSKMKVDVKVRNEGTIWQFFPLTRAAKTWAKEHVPDAPTLGNTFAVEHRFAPDIVLGMRNDGLVVTPF